MKKVILSRTDNLGDVILTLPMAGLLKKNFPEIQILFLGKAYTKPLIELCKHVDGFIDWDEISDEKASPKPGTRNPKQILQDLHADAIIHVFPVKKIATLAKRAGIPVRIGTSHRIYNIFTCNRLIHYSRRNSDLHEAQLNIKLLEGLGVREMPSLNEIPDYYGLKVASPPPSVAAGKEGPAKVILHPKSKGSAREWGLDNYSRLIELLPPEQFDIYVTGTASEGTLMKEFLTAHAGRVKDMTGKLSLSELIRFIGSCDGIVAASTGPLHIAAALGIITVGLYAPMRPIFPRRWAPLGKKAVTLALDKKCKKCRGKNECECIRSIRPEEVAEKLKSG